MEHKDGCRAITRNVACECAETITEQTTFSELALLLDAKGLRLTKLQRSGLTGTYLVRLEDNFGWHENTAKTAHEAINLVLRVAEQAAIERSFAQMRDILDPVRR